MLTVAQIKNAKPREKQYKLTDGGGLYLLIHSNGGKYWRLDYRFAGKRKTLSLGIFPDVTLSNARSRRDETRALIANNVDPSAERKAKKAADDHTFEAIAHEWYETQRSGWAQSHAERVWSRLERFAFPYIGSRPIDEIQPPDVLALLRRIEGRAIETAHRTKGIIGQVCRYGVATGRATSDPTASLKGALKAKQPEHHAALTDPDGVAELLRTIHEHARCEPSVMGALKVAPYVFVRPGELRTMRWSNLDIDSAEWRFRVSKTKTDHIVPLADQVIELIEELRPINGRSTYVFRGLRGDRPISDASLGAALQRLGIDTRTVHTTHGWRATARTLLHERLNYRPEVIEHQLAHRVPDTLGAAYNRTRFIDERRKMMQAYADYLDSLRDDSNVVAFKKPERA